MDEIQLGKLKTYLEPYKEWDTGEEKQLALLLQFAKSKILSQRYPFDQTKTELPVRYLSLQIRIAAELYAKMGAEGQTAHSENGISRSWESADVAQSLLNEVIPVAGVFSE